MAEARPACRLYLQLPVMPSPKAEEILRQAAGHACCVLLCPHAGQIDETEAIRLLGLAQERDLACLVKDDAALAKKIGADGVHIDADRAAYASARALLGEDATIGVFCGLIRHDAMELAEIGANYVAFGPNLTEVATEGDERAEIVAWWSEIFVIPCIAWDVSSAEEAAALADLGADFVAVPQTLLQEDDALARVAAIDKVLRERRAV